ncbi:MAG: T9SS type A sorting domain-containing protein [Chitinophagaceae bacterium]|nr:T9SS type A sorting domain-containing protein [Chitinophagaceae bacterium]
MNIQAQIYGCTDNLANNFNTSATINDGSCTYNSVICTPSNSWTMPSAILETSGLIFWNDKLWTHNDDTDNKLYRLDTIDINNYSTVGLSSCINYDWEEISQDDSFVYIGDFGNNVNGNRTDLKILRIDKISILQNNPIIDTIYFSYSLQSNFSPTGTNNTDFDCEAFIVSTDSIYLFTKEWVSSKCTIYSIPKTPGIYSANFISTYDVQGLITGATFIENKKLITLSGYSQLLQPFIFLLYDFNNYSFFDGNKRKIELNLPFHQVESIATIDGFKYFITNESFSQSSITTISKLHSLDLSSYLTNYLLPNSINSINKNNDYQLYPNPAEDYIKIKIDSGYNNFPYSISCYNQVGQLVDKFETDAHLVKMNVENYNNGFYYFVINGKKGNVIKGTFIKK